jgi:ABC-type cobalamin/Fe3+-siderophores transport system ATPase subunit
MSRHSRAASNDRHGDPAVRLKQVTLTVNASPIIHDITLSIDQGEFVLVLGPNGAGKTTLLKLINGLLLPSGGEILVFGQPLTRATAKQIRRHIAYLPQDIVVDTRIPISVREVVSIGRLAHKPLLVGFSDQDWAIIDEAMELVGIADLARRPFGQLSAGQKQKVSLARALSQQARIMLLDEPLSNLDPRAQRDVCDTIDRIHGATGKTILLVTHLLETVPSSADRAMIMRDGTFSGKVDTAKIYDDRFRHSLYSKMAESRESIEREGWGQ